VMGYGNGYGGGGYGGGYGGMMGGGGGWFVGLMMLLFGALFIALVVLLVVWAVRAASGHGHGQQHHAAVPPVTHGSPSTAGAAHDEAVAIAKRRLASGDITPEQYVEIMRHLGGERGGVA